MFYAISDVQERRRESASYEKERKTNLTQAKELHNFSTEAIMSDSNNDVQHLRHHDAMLQRTLLDSNSTNHSHTNDSSLPPSSPSTPTKTSNIFVMMTMVVVGIFLFLYMISIIQTLFKFIHRNFFGGAEEEMAILDERRRYRLEQQQQQYEQQQNQQQPQSSTILVHDGQVLNLTGEQRRTVLELIFSEAYQEVAETDLKKRDKSKKKRRRRKQTGATDNEEGHDRKSQADGSTMNDADDDLDSVEDEGIPLQLEIPTITTVGTVETSASNPSLLEGTVYDPTYQSNHNSHRDNDIDNAVSNDDVKEKSMDTAISLSSSLDSRHNKESSTDSISEGEMLDSPTSNNILCVDTTMGTRFPDVKNSSGPGNILNKKTGGNAHMLTPTRQNLEAGYDHPTPKIGSSVAIHTNGRNNNNNDNTIEEEKCDDEEDEIGRDDSGQEKGIALSFVSDNKRPGDDMLPPLPPSSIISPNNNKNNDGNDGGGFLSFPTLDTINDSVPHPPSIQHRFSRERKRDQGIEEDDYYIGGDEIQSENGSSVGALEHIDTSLSLLLNQPIPMNRFDSFTTATISVGDDDTDTCYTEENLCAICMSGYELGETLIVSKYCTHNFHKECILSWLDRHDDCPMCRVDMITETEITQAATTVVGKSKLYRAFQNSRRQQEQQQEQQRQQQQQNTVAVNIRRPPPSFYLRSPGVRYSNNRNNNSNNNTPRAATTPRSAITPRASTTNSNAASFSSTLSQQQTVLSDTTLVASTPNLSQGNVNASNDNNGNNNIIAGSLNVSAFSLPLSPN